MIVGGYMRAEIFRFLAAGGTTFLLELAVLYGLVEFLGVYYLLAAAIAFTIAVAANYVLCLRWVFRGGRPQNRKMMVLFLGSSVAGLGINQLCMWTMVSWLGFHYLIAKVISTAVVTAWNYVAKRRAVVG